MHIHQYGQLKQAKPRAATTNAMALTIVEVAIPTARFTDASELGELHRYVGHDVEITIRAEPLPMRADALRPMETLWSSNGEEHTRPGPTESCSECGRVIGDDEEADFYAPLAGPTRPVCGDCKQAIEDGSIASDAERQEIYREALDRGLSHAEAREVAWPAEAEAGEGMPEPADEDPAPVFEVPLGDRPMPERPADLEPVTAPIRRRR